MVDMLRMNRDKDKILSAIRMRGPSVPVGIAKSVGISPLFASAFLSELRGEEKIKISDMKVGSSPLYYLPGQEAMLENFVEHLNQKEREAFRLLKNNKLLVDTEETPVMRVALRAIKDFAVPLKINVNGEPKIFWKHFAVSDLEFEEMFRDRVLGEGKKNKFEGKVKEVVKEEKEIENVVEEIKDKKLELAEEKLIDEIKTDIEKTDNLSTSSSVFSNGSNLPTGIINGLIPISENVEKKKAEKKHKKKKSEGGIREKVKEEKESDFEELKEAVEKKIQESEFGKKVKDYLSGREIEILEVIMDKKKEFIAKIRADGVFGKQDYYMVAKDKKNVSDNDLTVVLQKAQSDKMPAIIMSIGELNKKGRDYISQWGNLIKFEKMEFGKKAGEIFK